MERSGFRGSWLTRLTVSALLAVGGCVLAVLAAEVAVRVVGLGSDQMLRPDPVLGVRFIESKTGLSQAPCYRADVSTNAEGWRGAAFVPDKPDGVYRILVLGDSFMAGLQVQDEETFSNVLARHLDQVESNRRVEVINFGVPSWGTDQAYLALREYGLSLKPDLVLLAFYAQNDVDDNHSAIRSETSAYPKPNFDVRDGKLVEVPFVDTTPWLIDVGRELAAPFRVYLLVRDALLGIPIAHRFLFDLGVVGIVPQEGSDVQAEGPVWEWPDRWRRQIGVYELEYPEDRNQAWVITEALLRRMHADANDAGAAFLVMGVSSPIEVMPEPIRNALTGDGPARPLDVDKPARLLVELARRNGMEHFSLVAGFRERIADSVDAFKSLYLDCDGHWTPAGHRLAAELAAREITARIGPPRR